MHGEGILIDDFIIAERNGKIKNFWFISCISGGRKFSVNEVVFERQV